MKTAFRAYGDNNLDDEHYSDVVMPHWANYAIRIVGGVLFFESEQDMLDKFMKMEIKNH